ncbi:MAG: leucine-rich repeat protein [Kiritimatiellaeota bacterium]|nr:leucine-rich repeat protein [Kiritimatiellota bacterium]
MMNRIRTENRWADAWRKVAVVSAIALLGVTQINAQISISSWTELAKIGNDISYPLNGNYLLTRDLTDNPALDSDYNTVPGGFHPVAGWTPIGLEDQFQGTFDGGGHTISGLWIKMDVNALDYQGLFGYVDGGTIKNLGVGIADDGVGIYGRWYVGGLVGMASGATIADCHVTGGILSGASSYVGGLVGRADSSTSITNCYATSAVIGSDSVGGLVGDAQNGVSITDCYATGNVSGNGFVGGLVGHIYEANISRCYATGTVSGDDHVGGLAGMMGGGIAPSSVTDCFALNPSVSLSSGSTIGRVLGNWSGGNLSDNFALETMKMKKDGLPVGTIVAAHDGTDGEDLSESDAIAGRGVYETSGWDFVNTWVDAPYAGYAHGPEANLPILRAFASAMQNPHLGVPAYTWYWDGSSVDASIPDVFTGGMITNALGWKFEVSGEACTFEQVDLYPDGVIDISDLILILVNYDDPYYGGPAPAPISGPSDPRAKFDLNGDSVVDEADFDLAVSVLLCTSSDPFPFIPRVDITVLACIQAPPSPDILDFSGDIEGGFRIRVIGDGVTSVLAGYKNNAIGLVLPDTLQVIGANAFMGSGFLGSLVIPDSVTQIASGAFYLCFNFDGELTLGDPAASCLTSIGVNAFAENSFVGSLTIPDSVVTIGESAFWRNRFDGTLTLGTSASSLTTIGDYAFSDNEFEGDLTIPDSVTFIGGWAFAYNALFNGALTLGENVETIGPSAFWGNPFDGSPLAIPDSVTYVGHDAFYSCVFSHVSSWGTLDTIFPNMFYSTTFTTNTFVIPMQIGSIGMQAFSYATFGSDVIVNDGVTNLTTGAFSFNCTFNRISLPSTGVGYGTGVFSILGASAREIYYRGAFPIDLSGGINLYSSSPGVTSYVTTEWVDDWNDNSLANSVVNGVDTTAGNIQSELATWHGRPILCGEWDWDDENLEYTVYLDASGDYPIDNPDDYTDHVTVRKGDPMPDIVLPDIPTSVFQPGPGGGSTTYYTFYGYTNANGVLYYYGDGTGARDWDQKGGDTLYAAVHVTPIFQPEITFYGNGGLFNPGTPSAAEWVSTHVNGDGFTPLAPPYYYNTPIDKPVRPGYTFLGWNSQADGSGDTVENRDPYGLHGMMDNMTHRYFFAQWTEGEEGDAETWVHVDVIRVSAGGDVDLEWAFADVETRLGITTGYSYVIEVCTDLTLMNWVTCASADLGRSFGNDSRRVLNSAMPVSDKRFFKVKAVKD